METISISRRDSDVPWPPHASRLHPSPGSYVTACSCGVAMGCLMGVLPRNLTAIASSACVFGGTGEGQVIAGGVPEWCTATGENLSAQAWSAGLQREGAITPPGIAQRGFLPGDSAAGTRAAQLPSRQLALISGGETLSSEWACLLWAPETLLRQVRRKAVLCQGLRRARIRT